MAKQSISSSPKSVKLTPGQLKALKFLATVEYAFDGNKTGQGRFCPFVHEASAKKLIGYGYAKADPSYLSKISITPLGRTALAAATTAATPTPTEATTDDEPTYSRILGVDGYVHILTEDGTAECGYKHFTAFSTHGRTPCRACQIVHEFVEPAEHKTAHAFFADAEPERPPTALTADEREILEGCVAGIPLWVARHWNEQAAKAWQRFQDEKWIMPGTLKWFLTPAGRIVLEDAWFDYYERKGGK